MWQSFFENKESNSHLMFENSQLLLKNQFQFIHPYDMEPCKEIVEFDDGIDWKYIPFDDEEWNYMLNRQEYLLDLCVSFNITQDKAYLEKGKELIIDWIDKNETTTNWRTIDTGIRLTYWQIMLAHLEETRLLNLKDKEKIVQSIYQQIAYLDEEYIEKYDLSNWGILITTGFFFIGQNKDISFCYELTKRMINRLTNQLVLQIQPSGNHWEQSPLYLMEVLRSLVLIHQSGVIKKDTLNELLEEKIRLMVSFMPHFVTPQGTTILQGDTDEMVVSDVMQTLSLLYDLRLPNMFVKKVRVDYALLYSSKIEIDFKTWQEEMKVRVDSNFITSLNDDYTGNYYHRNNWDSTASFCHLYNGSLGSGHGHLSLGHIDMAMKGDNIFVDSGRFTYVESSLRQVLKEAPQHNTVVINNQPFGKTIDSWGYDEVPTSLSNRTYEDWQYWTVRSMYLDNQVLGTYKVVRTILYLKEIDSFVVIDQVIGVNGSQAQNMTRYFHLSPHLESVLASHHVELKSVDKTYYVHFSETNISIKESMYAPKYNEIVANEVITTQSKEPSQFVLVTPINSVFIKQVEVKKTDCRPFSDSQCVGWKIVSHDTEWLIYSMVEDTYSGHKLYKVDGVPVYGQFGVVCLNHNESNNYTRIF